LTEQYELAQEREDRRAARVCMTISNFMRHFFKPTPKPFTEEDFIPGKQGKKPKGKQTPEQMKDMLLLFTAANGGKIEKGK